jgi:NUMOD3 motif
MVKDYYRIYCEHKNSASGRGIEFLLTFEEWLQIWQDSGHLHERGKHRGQYVMARFGDKGAYEVCNVKIILHSENIAEAQLGRIASLETRQKQSNSMRGITKSEEHKRKLSEANKGSFVSEERRKRVSEVHTGKVVSNETRQKLSDARKTTVLRKRLAGQHVNRKCE